MKFKKTTLASGLRIITVPVKGNPSVTVMVACETGSNYEEKRENGLAHFLEHMVFKGTPTRPSALQVALELDSIGAESNAFTGNEMTAYYGKGEKRHLKKILNVVSDIYLHPNFPETELEKERGVIIQEIGMYLDLPQRHVWDVLGKLLYGDTPAGRTILGPVENIKKFTKEDFLAYRKKHYTAKATTVIVAGDVDPKTVEAEVKKLFKDIPEHKPVGKQKVTEKQKAPALAIERKPSDQTHMVMAFRAFGARHKKSAAVSVLMSILGDGMSSRLFQKLREEMGACYYVRTANDAYSDHGLAAIATGIDKNRATEVVKAILGECKRLREEEVSAEELQKVKDYVVSHMYMGLETSDNLAVFFLDGEYTHGEARSPKDYEAKIRSVTPKDILKVAKEIFTDERLNLAIVGDIADGAQVKKALTFR